MIGYKFIKDNGFVWRIHHQVFLPLSMPHVDPQLTATHAKDLMAKHGVLLVRWETQFDQLKGGDWWHIIKDDKEELSELKSNVRSKIRRGLKSYDVRRCERVTIIEHGYPVYRSAYERYDTFEPMYTEAQFRNAIFDLPTETEFWVAIDKITKKFVGFSENLVRDDACFYVTVWLTPLSLSKYISYAMFHTMNTYYLNEHGCKYVSDGARSLSHSTNIHEFLQSQFGFRKAYSKLNVMFDTRVKVAVSIAYPFKSILKKINFGAIAKVNVLLELEHIRRAGVGDLNE